MQNPTSPAPHNAPIAAVILAAGKGTRMKSARPKVLHEIGGLSMLGHVLAALKTVVPARIVVVVGPGMEAVAEVAAPVPTAVQQDQLGTADALRAAREDLEGFESGTVLVAFGDTPFIAPATLSEMVQAREAGAAVVVLGFEPADPSAYGRLLTDGDGALQAIVEYKDADAATRKIGLCNSGVMAIDAAHLWRLADRIGNDNAKGEYYLTDIVGLARQEGLACRVVRAAEAELMGINDRAGLAAAEAAWQTRARDAAMAAGVTLIDPTSVHFSFDTALASDVTVEPNVIFGPGVDIAAGARIRAFSHLEGATIGQNAIIGPYARLRPGTEVGADGKIGNFVETKNARFGAGAKANHLSYVGDAEVGPRANIGAGTITCNYDGYLKHRTVIGEAAFIGSNTALVAPVEIGAGAIVGAGSTVTQNVAADALAVARGRQQTLPGRGAELKARLKARKTAEKD